jgi:hypothetical protein
MIAMNLTERLQRSRHHPNWSTDQMLATLRAISRVVDGSTVDFDDEAGEEWGRVLRNEPVVVLWTKGAFGFVDARYEAVLQLLRKQDVMPVPVVSWDQRMYSVDRASVRELFGRESLSEAVNLAQLSANELWWATV